MTFKPFCLMTTLLFSAGAISGCAMEEFDVPESSCEDRCDEASEPVPAELLRHCNADVQAVVMKNISGWLVDGPIPDWDNGHLGYEALHNELLELGAIADQYRHFNFGRSATFDTLPESGFPRLSVKFEGEKDRYSADYHFDPELRELKGVSFDSEDSEPGTLYSKLCPK